MKADIDDLRFERSAVESGEQGFGGFLADLCAVELDRRQGWEGAGRIGLVAEPDKGDLPGDGLELEAHAKDGSRA